MNRRQFVQSLSAALSTLMHPAWPVNWSSRRELRRATAPVRFELDDEYLRLIALVEALPENQTGADKTWVHRLMQERADTAHHGPCPER
jgi:hypothetical protein